MKTNKMKVLLQRARMDLQYDVEVKLAWVLGGADWAMDAADRRRYLLIAREVSRDVVHELTRLESALEGHDVEDGWRAMRDEEDGWCSDLSHELHAGLREVAARYGVDDATGVLEEIACDAIDRAAQRTLAALKGGCTLDVSPERQRREEIQ